MISADTNFRDRQVASTATPGCRPPPRAGPGRSRRPHITCLSHGHRTVGRDGEPGHGVLFLPRHL